MAAWKKLKLASNAKLLHVNKRGRRTSISVFWICWSALIYVFYFESGKWGYGKNEWEKNVSKLFLAQLPVNLDINLPSLWVLKWLEPKDQLYCIPTPSFLFFCSQVFVFSYVLQLQVFLYFFKPLSESNKGPPTGRAEVLHHFIGLSVFM